MARETVVLLVIAAAVGLAVTHLVRDTRRTGAPSIGRQLVFGLCCGLLGAVVAAVPYADVVPDDLEPLLLVLVPLVVCTWWLALRLTGPRARHARRRWPFRRRTPPQDLDALLVGPPDASPPPAPHPAPTKPVVAAPAPGDLWHPPAPLPRRVPGEALAQRRPPPPPWRIGTPRATPPARPPEAPAADVAEEPRRAGEAS